MPSQTSRHIGCSRRWPNQASNPGRIAKHLHGCLLADLTLRRDWVDVAVILLLVRQVVTRRRLTLARMVTLLDQGRTRCSKTYAQFWMLRKKLKEYSNKLNFTNSLWPTRTQVRIGIHTVGMGRITKCLKENLNGVIIVRLALRNDAR